MTIAEALLIGGLIGLVLGVMCGPYMRWLDCVLRRDGDKGDA